MSIEAMKKAAELIRKSREHFGCDDFQTEALDELDCAIAEAEKQKPEGQYALEQALTRLQKRYSELEAKVVKREWVELTDEEIDQGLLRSDYALQTAHAWRAGVVFAMTKLKEKNT